MPGAEVEAVVSAVAPVSSWTEVVEVPVGCRRVIVVVARNRSRDALETAPRRVVGSHEVGQLPVGVLVVPERERRRRIDRKNEPSRLPLLCARLPCLRDVSRCRDRGIAAGGRGVEDLKRVGRGRESQQDETSAHGILLASGPSTTTYSYAAGSGPRDSKSGSVRTCSGYGATRHVHYRAYARRTMYRALLVHSFTVGSRD